MSYDSNTSLDRALELAKKRAAQFSYLEAEDGGSSPSKRYQGADLNLKLLIPSNVSGHIIGKGGETIAELRRSSGTNIMMSKNNEMYPGTQDRVSLITGSKDAISDVVQLLVKKMKERLEELGESDTERDRTIKIVVPNSTIGMVIGKGGETVEEMKQRSGTNILISKKAEQKPQVPERVITLVGETRSNQIALDMILEKIAEDPNSGSCTNINYSEDGIMGALPTSGYGYASTPSRNGVPSTPGYDTINVNGHTNLRLTLNMHAPTPPDPWVSRQVLFSCIVGKVQQPGMVKRMWQEWRNSQAMPHINYSLRQAGHSDTVADELTRALGLLAAHGVLQLTQSAAKQEPAVGWAGESSYGYGTSVQPTPPGQTKSGLPYGTRPVTPPGESSGPPTEEEVQVEERLVGAVLGPSGRHVEEIKQYSGADVQISKRGIYHPGTTNRIITIKGSQRAVKSALYLVQQKIQEKQEERARSGR